MSSRPSCEGMSRACVATALFLLLPAPLLGQDARNDTARTEAWARDSLVRATVVPLGIRALTAQHSAPGVLGRVDSVLAPVLGEGQPLEALAGTIAGVRVYRPSGEPGSVPMVALHGRTTIHRTPAPLYVFDGVPLAAPPIDIATPGLLGIDVLSAQLGASWLGSAAHDGVIHLRTGALAPPPTGFATRVRSEIGTSWNSASITRNRHHDYLMNEAGQYVDADGNVVAEANRVREPFGFIDNPYPDGTFDPLDALFTPGLRHSVAAEVAGSLPRSSLWLSVGHDWDAGVVREREGYRRTHLHARSEHVLRDDLRVGFTGYYGRSASDDARLSDRLNNALRTPADFDLLERTPEGEYIRQMDPFALNPLWMLANARSDADGERLILGLRAAWTPLQWLSVDAAVGRDRLTQTAEHSQLYIFDDPRTITEEREHEYSLRQRTSTALALTARRDFFGTIASAATFAWTRMPLRDSFHQRIEQGPPCTLTGCAPSASFTQNWAPRPAQQTISAHLHGSLDERLALDLSIRREKNEHFPIWDQSTTNYRASAQSVLTSFDWWPVELLDRVALSASWGTLVGFMSGDEVLEGLSNPPIPTTPDDRWHPEREREAILAADLEAWQRLRLRISHAWVETQHAPIASGAPGSRTWRTIATLDRQGFEASVSADFVRRGDAAWTVGFTASRQELTIARLNAPCTISFGYRQCAGDPVGLLYGGHFLRSLEDLPAAHAGSQSAFAVNDDGLLVAMGHGGSLAAPQWGTTVTIDGIDYEWGMPILTTEADGMTPLYTPLANPTHWGVGFSSALRWRGFTIAAMVSGQLGGRVWDEIERFRILSRQSAMLDQSNKPEVLRKPAVYYNRLRTGPNDLFVEDASHLVLEHLSLRVRFGARWLGGGSIGADRLELAVVGRNLAGWSDRNGLFDDLASPMAGSDGLRHPRPRSLSVRLGVDF